MFSYIVNVSGRLKANHDKCKRTGDIEFFLQQLISGHPKAFSKPRTFTSEKSSINRELVPFAYAVNVNVRRSMYSAKKREMGAIRKLGNWF